MSATYKLTLKQSYMFFSHNQKSLLDMFARCVWGLTFMKTVFLDTAFSSGRDCFWAKDVTPAHNRLRYV